MMLLNPNCFYDNGNIGTGKLSKELRATNAAGTKGLLALVTAMKDRATADGTVGALATALGTVETQLGTPATFDKIVEVYG